MAVRSKGGFDNLNNKTCLGRFQVLRYKTFTYILGPIQENGFPVKIRNKIKVKFRVRNKGKIQGYYLGLI